MSFASPAIRIVVSDANQIACELLARSLRRSRGFKVVACVTRSREVAAAAKEHDPDITIVSVDLQEGKYSGLVALRELQKSKLRTRTIVLVDEPTPDLVLSAFQSGARGLFRRSESLALLQRCISAVHRGQIWAGTQELHILLQAFENMAPLRCVNVLGDNLLTPREQHILPLVAEGLSNAEIATQLGITEHTVKNHLFHVYEKLGISTRVELILYAVSERGLSFSQAPLQTCA